MYDLRDAFQRNGGGDVVVMPSGLTMKVAPRAEDGFFFQDDFLDALTSNLSNTGAGTQTIGASLQGRPGVNIQAATAAGVDGCRAICGVAGIGGTMEFGGLVLSYFRARGVLSAVPDGVDNAIVRVGWGDAATALVDHTDGVYLELDRATHGNNNWRLCAANNAVRTKVDTGIAATVNYDELEIEVNSSGTSAVARIAGVTTPAVTSNIPVTSARSCMAMLQFSKQLGGAARSYTWDFYEHGQRFLVGAQR